MEDGAKICVNVKVVKEKIFLYCKNQENMKSNRQEVDEKKW